MLTQKPTQDMSEVVKAVLHNNAIVLHYQDETAERLPERPYYWFHQCKAHSHIECLDERTTNDDFHYNPRRYRPRGRRQRIRGY